MSRRNRNGMRGTASRYRGRRHTPLTVKHLGDWYIDGYKRHPGTIARPVCMECKLHVPEGGFWMAQCHGYAEDTRGRQKRVTGEVPVCGSCKDLQDKVREERGHCQRFGRATERYAEEVDTALWAMNELEDPREV